MSVSLRVSVFLLVSSYAFGAIMLGHQLLDGFVYLTAPHLCLTTYLLLRHHANGRGDLGSRRRLLLWAVVCGILGWLAEYVGVHYGVLFGDYVYGEVLGPAWRGIPLVMAVNWVLVVYAVCASVEWVLGRRWAASVTGAQLAAKTGVAACLLVALDALIEPVAIVLDFWRWDAGAPPLHNFVGWLCVGALQAGIFYVCVPQPRNPLAPLVLVLQLVFFSYLNLVLV